jgi:hypothetical protein
MKGCQVNRLTLVSSLSALIDQMLLNKEPNGFRVDGTRDKSIAKGQRNYRSCRPSQRGVQTPKATSPTRSPEAVDTIRPVSSMIGFRLT